MGNKIMNLAFYCSYIFQKQFIFERMHVFFNINVGENEI